MKLWDEMRARWRRRGRQPVACTVVENKDGVYRLSFWVQNAWVARMLAELIDVQDIWRQPPTDEAAVAAADWVCGIEGHIDLPARVHVGVPRRSLANLARVVRVPDFARQQDDVDLEDAVEIADFLRGLGGQA